MTYKNKKTHVFWLRTEEFMFWTHTFTKSSEISGFFPGGGYKHVWFIGSFMFYWCFSFSPVCPFYLEKTKIFIQVGWLGSLSWLRRHCQSVCFGRAGPLHTKNPPMIMSVLFFSPKKKLNLLCFPTKYESVSTPEESSQTLNRGAEDASDAIYHEFMVRHHCLYGNELADSEDVRWWLKQRQGAPLDHQAGIEPLPFDSFGCMRVDRTTIK